MIHPVIEAERSVLLPETRPGMLEWARENYVLSSKTSALPGPWSDEYVPFMREPMKRLSQPGPCTVIIAACTQAGKSELGNIFLGYTVEIDPAPFMFILPRAEDTRRRLKTRVRPMFETMPRLRAKLKRGRVENLNVGEPSELAEMFVFLGWAESPAALADVAVCKEVLDEVGKWPRRAGKETSPVDLAKERTRTFAATRAKILETSTPVLAGDDFDKEFASGHQADWWAPCPHCGRYQVLEWTSMILAKRKKPDGRTELLDGSEYESDEATARYRCIGCETLWTEADRWLAVSAGQWLAAGLAFDEDSDIRGAPVREGNIYSYRITALMLHPQFVRLNDLAAKWARAQDQKNAGDTRALQHFLNSQLAQAWKELGRSAEENKIKAKRLTELPNRTIPAECTILTAGADYHESEHGIVRIDAGIIAWGPGKRMHVVDTARLDCFEALEEWLFEDPIIWPATEPADRAVPAIRRVFIDSGFKPTDVYDWCRDQEIDRPGVCIPVKGSGKAKVPLRISKLDEAVEKAERLSRRKRAADYRGMFLWLIDTEFFKDVVTTRADRGLHEAGAMTLAAGIEDWFCEELTSEHKIPERRGRQVKNVWVRKTPTSQTHGLDVAVYATAAGFSLKAHRLRDPAKKRRRRLSQVQREKRAGKGR